MTLQWGGLQNRSISRKKKVNNSLKCSLGCFSILAYMLAVAAVRACPPLPSFFLLLLLLSPTVLLAHPVCQREASSFIGTFRVSQRTL